ncbi:hypothetical protein LTR08_002813 [Meristemomyces frigidus]|nr:hypothetical protein LTR08_002813 [Meristemomyces frigidus]
MYFLQDLALLIAYKHDQLTDKGSCSSTRATVIRIVNDQNQTMGAAAYAVPVGALGGIAVAMFIFICWWFPRHYKKGVKMDQAEVDASRRERGLAALNELGQAQPGTEAVPHVKPMPKIYLAPVTPY